jgi:hypothetical protein
MAATDEKATSPPPPRKQRQQRPKTDVFEAAQAALSKTHAKLDALIQRPCQEDALEAIALCRHAAAALGKARQGKLRAAEKQRASTLSARAKKDAARQKQRSLAARKKAGAGVARANASKAVTIIDSEDDEPDPMDTHA